MDLSLTKKRQVMEEADGPAHYGKNTTGKADIGQTSGSGDRAAQESAASDANIENTGINGHGHRCRTDRKMADNLRLHGHTVEGGYHAHDKAADNEKGPHRCRRQEQEEGRNQPRRSGDRPRIPGVIRKIAGEHFGFVRGHDHIVIGGLLREDRDLLLDPKASAEAKERYLKHYSGQRLRRHVPG